MLSLLLDTSSNLTCVAIGCEGIVTTEIYKRFVTKKLRIVDHAKVLPEAIEEAISSCDICNNIKDIENIGIISGPGSFTGVRIGVAYAKGLACGLKVPLFDTTIQESFKKMLFSEFISKNISELGGIFISKGRKNSFYKSLIYNSELETKAIPRAELYDIIDSDKENIFFYESIEEDIKKFYDRKSYIKKIEVVDQNFIIAGLAKSTFNKYLSSAKSFNYREVSQIYPKYGEELSLRTLEDRRKQWRKVYY